MVFSDSSREPRVGGFVANGGAPDILGNLMTSMKEKVQSVGGNEFVSKVTSSIPQGTRELILEAKTKFFKLDYLRSLKTFLGVGEEKPFYLEFSLSLIIPRVTHNLKFFYMNYMLITGTLFFLTLLISPSAIIVIGLLALTWITVIKSTIEGSYTIKGYTFSQRQVYSIMLFVSLLIFIYLLSNIFWWTLGSSGFLVGIHSFLRDASIHKDEGDKIKMTGDMIDSEDTIFLNP